MRENRSAQVSLWGEVVGYIALDQSGKPLFEFDPSFKKIGLEISPIELPLRKTGIFSQTNPATSFMGLPGIIADALPDRFGMRVVEDFYRIHFGLQREEVDIIKRLLYIGPRAVGALEFSPATSGQALKDELIKIEMLTDSARKTLEGQADVVSAEIMRIGASAGGAQAKAMVDYNPETNQMRSGFLEAKSGFIPCMIKFDGLRDGEEEGIYGRLEFLYNELARRCGLDVPKTYLLEDEGRTHFIVERFDRTLNKEKPYHYASLSGLLTRDFYQKYSCTYEEYFKLVKYLTNDMSQVLDAFKLAVFNIVFRNQDDHTKNFGFLMNPSGEWKLAPAFDLNYVNGPGMASTHQMKLSEKDKNFNEDDLITAGKKVGIKKNQVRAILDLTLATRNQFIELGLELDLEADFLSGVLRNFEGVR